MNRTGSPVVSAGWGLFAGAGNRLIGAISDPDFQVPTTVDAVGSFLYAVNARFGTPVTPDTTYTVVRVDGR